jgi:hypothetical protein
MIALLLFGFGELEIIRPLLSTREDGESRFRKLRKIQESSKADFSAASSKVGFDSSRRGCWYDTKVSSEFASHSSARIPL